MKPIPVIDLFAGAGGLGEGFSACRITDQHPFHINLSVEKDAAACKTLRLRSFYRQFSQQQVPEDYYRFLRGETGLQALYEAFPGQSKTARDEVFEIELGKLELTAASLDKRIKKVLKGAEQWVLVGGPPCQAYSIAGRARNRAKKDYVPEADDRHFLYEEYLRVISNHWPSVFVMENVPGILSSKVGGIGIFGQIMEDLSDPTGLSKGNPVSDERAYRYRLYSLAQPTEHDMFGVPVSPTSHFIIESQRFGIPQSRHRVVVLGVRDDIPYAPLTLKEHARQINVEDVLEGLPPLRSGLTRSTDTDNNWIEALGSVLDTDWYEYADTASLRRTTDEIARTIEALSLPEHGRGSEFVPWSSSCSYRPDWFLDSRMQGICNSETRAHFKPDLHRYLFAASFARTEGQSPKLIEFPEELMPEHKSVDRALKTGDFGDRFRVQVPAAPSTTITSHIGRDGHYYIHYDPAQCRCLTVREAARLQTFPDNFYFFGNRGEQYTQVGNAIPPMLASQIAGIVHNLLQDAESDHDDRYAYA